MPAKSHELIEWEVPDRAHDLTDSALFGPLYSGTFV